MSPCVKLSREDDASGRVRGEGHGQDLKDNAAPATIRRCLCKPKLRNLPIMGIKSVAIGPLDPVRKHGQEGYR